MVSICPVCLGKTQVSASFYNSNIHSAEMVTCKSCHGRGVFVEHPVIYQTPQISNPPPLNPPGYPFPLTTGVGTTDNYV